MTTQIVKQIFQCDQAVVEPPSDSIGYNHPRVTNPPKKTHDEAIARLASVKLEDGDVKGAVRLLCSNDRLASPDDLTFDDPRRLHPIPLLSVVGRYLQPLPRRSKSHLLQSVRQFSHSQMVQQLVQTVFGQNTLKIF